MKKVYYLSPSSFCFWVKRSIDQLKEITRNHTDKKIYCIHALVHNPKVTKEFEDKGVQFVEGTDEILENDAIIVFSAHGTDRSIIKQAEKRFNHVYNLECPFVSKIYTEADSFLKRGITKFVYIGKEHHQEGKNIIWYIMHQWGEVIICERNEQIKEITYDPKVIFAVLSQTTLNFSFVQKMIDDIKNIFPEAQIPTLSDVCKATYERQTVVLDNLEKFDTFIVIWWKESNNTKELYEIGKKNHKRCFFWESLEDIIKHGESELFADEKVAITWWASTPEEDIREIFEYYKNNGYEAGILTL